MDEARINFSKHNVIDYGWNSPVCGKHKLVSTVDTMNNKVIKELIFNRASNNMGTTCTLNFLQKMKDHQII